MTETRPMRRLRDIDPAKILRNPENPRLFFRPEEVATLMSSIKRYGIQVPISVYEADGKFVLIDGERRWRCATKLNLQTMPAIVQGKPSELSNLLLMFNIHALREEWDYLTIALKLPRINSLFTDENGYEPNEIELSEVTGLTRGQIRRCRYLMELPKKYRALILSELRLPKARQKLNEDLFIEMERALRTVAKRVPEAITEMDTVRDALIVKYRDGVIRSVTDFRMVSKIATSIERLGLAEKSARKALRIIFNPRDKTEISEIYEEYVEFKLDASKVLKHVKFIIEFVESIPEDDEEGLDSRLVEGLAKLSRVIKRLIGE